MIRVSVEGKNVEFLHRYPAEQAERHSSLARELVQSKVDVIIAVSADGAVALKQLTKTIPIVFVVVPDPIGSGLVELLHRQLDDVHPRRISPPSCTNGISELLALSRSPCFASATVPPLIEFNGGYIANPVDGDLTQPTPPERGQMGQLLSAALSPKSGASLIK